MTGSRHVGRWVEKWNGKVNGGTVSVVTQTVFGRARWRVEIEPAVWPKRRTLVIANGTDIRRELKNAAEFIRDRADVDGHFQVEPYLETEEYLAWESPDHRVRRARKDARDDGGRFPIERGS